MCRPLERPLHRAVWWGTVGLSLLACVPAATAGQNTYSQDGMNALWDRLDSLERRWEAENAPSAAREGWEREKVGPVTVVAPTGQGPALRAAVEARIEALPAWTGSGGLQGGVLFFAEGEEDGRPWVEAGEVLVTVRPSRWARGPEARAAKGLDQLVVELFPEDVRAWTAGHSALSPPDPVPVFRSVVAGGLEVTEGCRAGNIEDCAWAMGLSGRPLAEAYTAEELRALVLAADPGWTRQATEWTECEGGLEEACRAFVGRRGREGLRPFPPSVRHSLLLTALEIGGEGALARMRQVEAGSGSPVVAARLEAASGRSVEALLAAWQAEFAVAPERRAGPPLTALAVAALWLGLAATYSIRRPRWLDR